MTNAELNARLDATCNAPQHAFLAPTRELHAESGVSNVELNAAVRKLLVDARINTIVAVQRISVVAR